MPSFVYKEIWFTIQNTKPLETKDKVNLTLISNQYKENERLDWI